MKQSKQDEKNLKGSLMRRTAECNIGGKSCTSGVEPSKDWPVLSGIKGLVPSEQDPTQLRFCLYLQSQSDSRAQDQSRTEEV